MSSCWRNKTSNFHWKTFIQYIVIGPQTWMENFIRKKYKLEFIIKYKLKLAMYNFDFALFRISCNVKVDAIENVHNIWFRFKHECSAKTQNFIIVAEYSARSIQNIARLLRCREQELYNCNEKYIDRRFCRFLCIHCKILSISFQLLGSFISWRFQTNEFAASFANTEFFTKLKKISLNLLHNRNIRDIHFNSRKKDIILWLLSNSILIYIEIWVWQAKEQQNLMFSCKNQNIYSIRAHNLIDETFSIFSRFIIVHFGSIK